MKMDMLPTRRLMLVLGLFLGLFSCKQNDAKLSNEEIMRQLSLSANGKTEVVKNFPENFPEVLTERGEPIVYTRENSNNFEYIGMPVGGIGAGQLYLGGDGQLWFWDIFGLNYYLGQLKGEEAYEFPYERSKPNEHGALTINQGFSVTAHVNGEKVTKLLNRDGFENIERLTLVSGWMENAVLIEARFVVDDDDGGVVVGVVDSPHVVFARDGFVRHVCKNPDVGLLRLGSSHE